MILHRECPLCGSKILKGFAIDTLRKGPHISRVKCENCNLVFANPMADEKELESYYNNYYEKEHYEAVNYKQLISEHFIRISTLNEESIRKEAVFLKLLGGGTRFLDVGCGLGLGLAYANQMNCELFATEFDSGALEFVKSHFPVTTFHGDIWEANYPDSTFDFIHISHVIEHVLDPIAYIQEMKRILKPGGHLAIGTPNFSSNLYKIHRWVKLLKLEVPDIIDGVEHTFLFPKELLQKICEEQGFNVVQHFTQNYGEKLSNLVKYKMSLRKKLNRLVQNMFQVNQWIVCEKNN
ncbi:MAG: SAM-dependent methyltransferase [Algoriphagus sp.]|nr:SAM-dependent methyltransferase [Algoriphagus sp.]